MVGEGSHMAESIDPDGSEGAMRFVDLDDAKAHVQSEIAEAEATEVLNATGAQLELSRVAHATGIEAVLTQPTVLSDFAGQPNSGMAQ